MKKTPNKYDMRHNTRATRKDQKGCYYMEEELLPGTWSRETDINSCCTHEATRKRGRCRQKRTAGREKEAKRVYSYIKVSSFDRRKLPRNLRHADIPQKLASKASEKRPAFSLLKVLPWLYQ